MNRRRPALLAIDRAAQRLVLTGVALLAVASTATIASASSPTGSTFTVAPLPQATGVTYGASAGGRNEDVEPGIGITPDGALWVGSNIDPNTTGDPRAAAAVAGEDVWTSKDGGPNYQWVAAPFNPNNAAPGPGGEDSDLQVATAKNSNGFYNIYATSLYVAASNVAISQDGGQTWTDITVGGIPAQDRPWLSTDGACVFYLTYHQLPLLSPIVNKYDICNLTDLGAGFSLNPVQSTTLFTQNTAPGLTNGFNKPFVDTSPTSPHQHNIYIPMEACNLQNPQDYVNNGITTAEQVPTCPPGVNTEVEVAVSSDGGQTFSDYVVAQNSNGEQQVWPTSLAVDSNGVVYVAWSDNHHAFVSRSTDAGQTWSPAQQVDGLGSAVYPTIAATGAGIVDVAYYGTTTAGDSNDPAAMGASGSQSGAQWHVYLAKSTDGEKSFLTEQVSGVNHTGELCTKGAGCTDAGSRNLYDDFGLVINPSTGLATIAFDADEPMSTAPGATAVDPYTAVATELAGPAANLPEAPAGAVAALLLVAAGAAAMAVRRRAGQPTA